MSRLWRTDEHTDGKWKVEQYSVGAESAKEDTNIKGRTKIRFQALGLTCMIKDVGLYDVVFIFWKLTNLNFETPQMCYAWPHLYHFFFGSWQHGIFFIIKDFVSKILKGKRLFGQGCLRVLDKSKNFQELQQTFEKLEDSESSFWGQRGQLRCDGLLMWQRCNTLKKKTGLKAIIMFEVTEDDGNIH